MEWLADVGAGGLVHYLAHFNARRATYSSDAIGGQQLAFARTAAA